MHHQSLPKKAAFAFVGKIKDLVRNDDIPGREIFAQGAAGADTDDFGHAELLEGVDIRAVIDFGGRNRVPDPVAR